MQTIDEKYSEFIRIYGEEVEISEKLVLAKGLDILRFILFYFYKIGMEDQKIIDIFLNEKGEI